MSKGPLHRPARDRVPHPVPFAALPDTWAALAPAPVQALVTVPGPGTLAAIGRANLPVMLGRTLIRIEKASGKWQASTDDLREAARDLAALTIPPANPDASPAVLHTTDPGWPGKLTRMLRDTTRPNPAWTGPDWKKHWYWGCQWGCLNLTQIATTHDDGETWTIPQPHADFLTTGAARMEQALAERRHCSRCGSTAVRRLGWADVDTAAGWESLCADCLAAHTVQLREYAGQLRDIPYARARYRRENPPTWYACVVCGQPAIVWDHCHEHGYIRGPLCRGCNANDRWLFRVPYREGRLPIDHVHQCKGCAGAYGGPTLGITAAIIQYWISTLATTPDHDEHPNQVKLTAFPGKQTIGDAIRQRTYAVEPVAWTCTQCDEQWERQIDPDQLLAVRSQVPAYLRSGDLALITLGPPPTPPSPPPPPA